MAKHSYLKFIVLLLIMAGCEEYKYCIEMKPCGQGIERKLICPDNLPEDQRETIAKLFEKQIDPNIFWGMFDTNLPNDVGGAGFYTTFNTDMGQAAFYSERFRGDDNLNDTLQKVQMIADRSVDFLIGWFEYELGDDPNFVKFKAFCNENIRHDIKNMVIYFSLLNIIPEYESTALEEIAEIALYSILIDPNLDNIRKSLLDKHYLRKHGRGAYYGQKKDNKAGQK